MWLILTSQQSILTSLLVWYYWLNINFMRNIFSRNKINKEIKVQWKDIEKYNYWTLKGLKDKYDDIYFNTLSNSLE